MQITENEFASYAVGHMQFSYPWVITTGGLGNLIGAILPPLPAGTPTPIKNKWDEFRENMKHWFSDNAKIGMSTASASVLWALVLSSMGYAASQGGFSLWGADGIPSYPGLEVGV